MSRQATLCFLLQLIFELSSSTNIRVIPGSNLKLPCLPVENELTEGADITWKFNGSIIPTNVQSSDGFYLSISPVTTASEGKYECLVKGSEVEVGRMFYVTVDGFSDYKMKVIEKSDAKLLCNIPNIPNTGEVKANALWFKEAGGGERRKLNLEDDSTDIKKLFLLYPNDHDQTIIVRDIVTEDAGTYHCESAEGQKLSTVHISVEVGPTRPTHSCQGSTTAWEPCQDENSRIAEPVLQESITGFSMNLYSHLRELYVSENLLFSPVSISGALSHLLLGARNNTRRAIERAINVPSGFHCVHVQMKKLREKLSGSLQMASQIYYKPQMNLSETFTSQSIQFYDAEPTKLLNTNEGNTQMINHWVANKTKNKITHLVDSVPPSTELILLNAVSFSGQWKFKFNEKPKKGLFTKLNGDMVKVPLLYHSKYMATMIYSAGLKAQVARFALTGDSSLYILLPSSYELTSLQKVEEKMTVDIVGQMITEINAAAPQPMEVTLPQIKLDVQPDINLLFKKLGLSTLYEGANLCGLYPEEKVFLDDARHKAFLALTEKGVEAGAVTTLSFSRSFPSFSALRPFIMLLWSDNANVPLFIGRVTNP